MADLRYWSKATKLDRGLLGTALAVTMADKSQKKLVLVGILTVSDDCANGLVNDIVGQKTKNMIDQMKKYQVVVKVRKIVPRNLTEITNTLRDWADSLGLDLIFTTGGAAAEPRDVTPEATKAVIEKEMPGIGIAMTVAGLKLDPTSLLFRGTSGVRNKVLIINLPGALQSTMDCLNAIIPNLPYVISQLKNSQPISDEIPDRESFTSAIERPKQIPTSHNVPSLEHTLSHIPVTSHGLNVVSSPSRVDSGISTSHHLASHHASDVLSSVSRHDVVVSAGHHDVTSLTGHHGIISAPSHHDVSSVPGPRNVTSTPGHQDVTSVPGHHDVISMPGRQDVISMSDHHDVVVSSDHHGIASSGSHHVDTESLGLHDATGSADEVRSGLITEEELLGGDSFEGLLARESLRIIGDRPVAAATERAGTQSITADQSKIARRPRSSPFSQVSVDKASAIVFAITNPLPVVSKFFKDAFDHVVAEDVKAVASVPRQATAILDGYAVIASDTPGDLEVIPNPKKDVLTLGKTVRVTTGAPMPLGSDAVVPVEETLVVSEANNGRTEVIVRCLDPSTRGQHIRAEGSDVKSGQVVVKAGTKLGHLEIALLASVGVKSVRVHPLPVVAVISFGSKLREPEDNDVAPDEIRDTNRMTLLLALQKRGFPTVDMGIVREGKTQLKDTIIRAYQKADVILTTGGAAMGENDTVKPLLLELGASLHFARVIMKPGAPTAFATLETQRGKKLFFALSGVPIPAYVAYHLFVLPCLRRLSGSKDPRSAVVQARLSSDVYLDAVPDFQRAALRNEGKDPIPWADITGRQIISRMLSLVAADALLILPTKSDERSVIKRGELVDSMLIV